MVGDFSSDAAESASPTLCFIIRITAFKVVRWLSLGLKNEKENMVVWADFELTYD